jgi:hypothetical protein
VNARWVRILGLVAYWVAVLVLAVALLVGLILLIESRDKSSVRDEGALVTPRRLL